MNILKIIDLLFFSYNLPCYKHGPKPTFMKIFLTKMAIVAITVLHAQEFRGIAEYKSLFTFKNMSFSITTSGGGNSPADEAKLKEMFEKPMEDQFRLSFNRTESVYEELPKLEKPTGDNFTSAASHTLGKRYKNIKENKTIVQMDMYGKEFVVRDTLTKYNWKLENETKKIGNYICYKATHTIKARPLTEEENKKREEKKVNILGDSEPKDIVVTAWYTPEIPVSQGPAGYWGLPGLILETSDGNRQILCTKIVLNPKEKVEIKVPTRGQKVTQEEFRQIMNKKSEEMQQMHSPAPGSKTTTIQFGN
jgi:GLPGLI family protein